MAIGLLFLVVDLVAVAPEAALTPEAAFAPEAVVRGNGLAGNTASDDRSNRELHISCVLKVFILFYRVV